MKVYELEGFVFESRETYDAAKREYDMVLTLNEKVDFNDTKSALKVYNKFVTEKTFTTVIGYSFLLELRKYLLESGTVTSESLAEIPVREYKKQTGDTIPQRPKGESKYRRMYDEQKKLNAKLKIVVIAAVVLLLGFTAITVGTDYSVFTYFTNYKANMEEELIDKYESWEEELKAREDALEQSQGGSYGGE